MKYKKVSDMFKKVLVKNKKNRVPEEKVNWIDLWEKSTGVTNPICSNLSSCTGESEEIVGGHVYKVDKQGHAIEDEIYYIVPLCKSCNDYRKTEPFEVYELDLRKESDLLSLKK